MSAVSNLAEHKIYLLQGFAIAVGRGGRPQADGSFLEQPDLHDQYLVAVFQQSNKKGFVLSGSEVKSLADKTAFDSYISQQRQSMKRPDSVALVTEEQARAFFGPNVRVQTLK